jgi:hypothetical protein
MLGAPPLDFQGWDSWNRQVSHPPGLFPASTTKLGAPPLDFQGWDSQKTAGLPPSRAFSRIYHKAGCPTLGFSRVGFTEANTPPFQLFVGSTTDLGAPPLDFQGWDSQKRHVSHPPGLFPGSTTKLVPHPRRVFVFAPRVGYHSPPSQGTKSRGQRPSQRNPLAVQSE